MTDDVKRALEIADDNPATGCLWHRWDLNREAATCLAAEARRLEAESAKLRDELDRTRGELEAANKHVEIVCDARDDIHRMHVKALTDISKLRDLLRRGHELLTNADDRASQQWCDEVEAVIGDAPGEKGGAKR